MTAVGYSEIIHRAIIIYFTNEIDYKKEYELLDSIAKSYDPWELWAPYFSISHDHGIMLLSEFPLILTLLTLAFSKSEYSKYFTQIQFDLMRAYNRYNHWSVHSFIWILISAQISKHREAYNFARDIINENGGLDIKLIYEPTLSVSEEPDEKIVTMDKNFLIPDFDKWNLKIKEINSNEKVDLLPIILDSLLIMNNPFSARDYFAKFCIYKSIDDS